jgi:hypothetical protein
MKNCITCDHQPNRHYTMYTKYITNSSEIAPGEQHCLEDCLCDFFVTNNLDYIEHLAKKKQLI